MNKELAELIIGRIAALPFIDRIAGLVKTIETTDKSEAANPKTIRFPAAESANKPNNYLDLVPNSTKKSIFYVESLGPLKPGSQNAKGFEMESTLRLVGWMNSRFPVGSDSLAIASILKRFPDQPFNSGAFTRIRMRPTSILSSEDKIFSKYTYDEKVSQFLMLPFHAFAIDFTINFTLKADCFPEYVDESVPSVA